MQLADPVRRVVGELDALVPVYNIATMEETLAEFWQELVGIEQVGIHDDFFELGGHSLIAVRLFARISKAYGVEEPISVLFEAPTIARLADTLRERIGEGGQGERGASLPTRRRARRRRA